MASQKPRHSFADYFRQLAFHNSTIQELSLDTSNSSYRSPRDAFVVPQSEILHARVKNAFEAVVAHQYRWCCHIHLIGSENLANLPFQDRSRIRDGIYIVNTKRDDLLNVVHINYFIFLNRRLCSDLAAINSQERNEYLLKLTKRTHIFAIEFLQVFDHYNSIKHDIVSANDVDDAINMLKSIPSGEKNGDVIYGKRLFSLLASHSTIKSILQKTLISHMTAKEFDDCHEGDYYTLKDINYDLLNNIPADSKFNEVKNYYLAWLEQCRVHPYIVQAQTMKYLKIRN